MWLQRLSLEIGAAPHCHCAEAAAGRRSGPPLPAPRSFAPEWVAAVSAERATERLLDASSVLRRSDALVIRAEQGVDLRVNTRSARKPGSAARHVRASRWGVLPNA
jgi:hypothetical protein